MSRPVPSSPARQTPRVAIIGAGFSGIAAAVALHRKGIDDYVVFEQADGVGGTWWYNRYPGAEVDLESHIYSFSFARADWTRTHAPWHELQAYLDGVADTWDIKRHVKLGEKVDSITWDEEDRSYRVETTSGADHGSFHAVISAVGFLNLPLLPPFARGETAFEGAICHTSRWIEGLDMTGKSVAVVGTGSSAVQIVAEAERVASDVTIFQLEPNWVLPKGDREFSAEERRQLRNPIRYKLRRWKLYADYDARQVGASHARRDGRFNRRRHARSLQFLRESLADRPDLLELVTPDFAFEGRRTVTTDTYYPALKSPKVTLVPRAVKEITRTGVIDAAGDSHDFDVIVMATGFDASNYLGNYRVVGEGGRLLSDVWQGEPDAFLGLMVPGFPNFFMMYGPNTNGIPLVHFYEAQGAFAAGLINRLRGGKRRVAVRKGAYERYNRWLQKRLRRTVWAETMSYFKSGTGKVVSQWPASPTSYILATKLLRRIATRVD